MVSSTTLSTSTVKRCFPIHGKTNWRPQVQNPIADVALCSLEAVKGRMQTTLPPYAHSLCGGWSKSGLKGGIGVGGYPPCGHGR